MNSDIKNNIFEMLDTLIEASEYLIDLDEESKYMELNIILNDMLDMMTVINNAIINSKDNSKKIQGLRLQCESVRYSIENISTLFRSRSEKFVSKIKFELIPLLQEMKVSIYLLNVERECIYNSKEHAKNLAELSYNKYIEEAESKGKYKYDLSILVTAYNKLDYTKLCVESILNNVPIDINYEIILMNHGSTDETKEYFEKICPTKQIDILKNGGGSSAWTRVIEGRYCLCVSNDVMITPNAISNMLECIESDEKIGWVVPTTGNVSNRQSIKYKYSNFQEMIEFSLKNNICDKYRWEQRPRLCNPVDLMRSDMLSLKKLELKNNMVLGRFSFPDDSVSMVMRRNGYKMILAKDAFCHHFGSITVNDEIKEKSKECNTKTDFYTQGRNEFHNSFGIDPWGTGVCWNTELFEYIECNEKGSVDVLGINCGIGSNPLKIKESIKENQHNLDVTIYNVTDEQCYIEDLKGVSDFAELIPSCDNIKKFIERKKFKYIIFESKFEKYKNSMNILADLQEHLVEGGVICIKTNDEYLKEKIKDKHSNVVFSGEWIIFK